MWKSFQVNILAAFIVTTLSVTAGADDVVVSGMAVVLTGEIDGNVIVEDGGAAVLDGVAVKGNVIVKPGGTLSSEAAVTSIIDGNVQAEEAVSVSLAADIVVGNVQIRKSGTSLIEDSIIVGSVQIEESDGATYIDIVGNQVFGDVQVFRNMTTSASFIELNTILGNLQCSGNGPDPFVLDNLVGGGIECED